MLASTTVRMALGHLRTLALHSDCFPPASPSGIQNMLPFGDISLTVQLLAAAALGQLAHCPVLELPRQPGTSVQQPVERTAALVCPQLADMRFPTRRGRLQQTGKPRDHRPVLPGQKSAHQKLHVPGVAGLWLLERPSWTSPCVCLKFIHRTMVA